MTRPRDLMRVLLMSSLWLFAACGETPTTPTDVPDASAQPFSSRLLPGTSAARAFSTSTRGTVSLTLSSTTPAGTRVGLGIGITRADGSGCSLSIAVEAVAGASPQLAATADAGSYCAQVFDLGNLTEPVTFTLSISHP